MNNTETTHIPEEKKEKAIVVKPLLRPTGIFRGPKGRYVSASTAAEIYDKLDLEENNMESATTSTQPKQDITLFGGLSANDTKGLLAYIRENNLITEEGNGENKILVGRLDIQGDTPIRTKTATQAARQRLEHRLRQKMQDCITANAGEYHINENCDYSIVMEKLPSINQRFKFVENFVSMAAKKIQPAVILTGEGGVGKSYTVSSVLESMHMIDYTDWLVSLEPENRNEIEKKDDAIRFDGENIVEGTSQEDADKFVAVPKNAYICIKGYSTARALYTMLYHCRRNVVVLDDCDNIMKDAVGLNVLKGALDTHPNKARYVSWQSGGKYDIPNTFKFEGSVIFISNLPTFKIDQALRTRAMVVDLSMTPEEKFQRMQHIVHLPEFMPDYDSEIKRDVLAFVGLNLRRINNINFRTLVLFTRLAREHPSEWELMALFQIRNQS